MALNLVVLIGNLVADPELKTTSSGLPVTSFRIAVSRKFSQEAEADFIDIVAWRKTAEFVTRYFRKGSPILVRGTLQTRTWATTDGQKRKAVEVVADEISFVGKKDEKNEKISYGNTDGLEEVAAEDDLPF